MQVKQPARRGLARLSESLALMCAPPCAIVERASGRWEIELNRGGETLSIREADRDELEQVYALGYQVYVEEMGVLPPERITVERAIRRQLWDDFDASPHSRHFVALADGRVVACLRLVGELEGDLPLERNGFSLDGEREAGARAYELGRFFVSAPYRGAGLVDAFFALLWYVCSQEAGIGAVFLSCEPKLERLYARAGARRLGRFHHTEFGREYSAMRIDIVDDFRRQFGRGAPRAGRAGYIMENPDEAVRLETQTDPDESREHLEITGLRPGMRALDVGCGPGTVTRQMARIAGVGSVVGVDRSGERLAAARSLAPLPFVAGDVYGLPFGTARFDFTWSRFLFEYLGRPQEALAELVRVTRPGGTVAIADLDGQVTGCHPLPDDVRREIQSAFDILATTGFDPWVGRKLHSHFLRAGLEDVSVRVFPFEVYAGGIPERDLPNWRIKIGTIVRLLGHVTNEPDHWASVGERFLAAMHSREMFYYCNLVLVWGRVPSEESP